MAKTFAFAWNELEGSPEITIGEDGFQCVRQIVVPWNQAVSFVAAMRGSRDNTLNGYVPPGMFGDSIAIQVVEAKIVPFGGVPKKANNLNDALPDYVDANDLTTTGSALVTLTYRDVQDSDPDAVDEQGNPVNDPGNPFNLSGSSRVKFDYRRSPSIEIIKTAGRGLRFADGTAGGAPVGPDCDPGIIIPVVEHSLTIYEVRAFGDGGVGKVNEAPINFFGYVLDVETLMYVGTEVQKTLVQTAELTYERAFNITRRFLQRGESTETGWNALYNPAAKAFDLVYRDLPNLVPLHLSTDFSHLFAF